MRHIFKSRNHMIKQLKLYGHYLLPKYLLTQFAGLLANSEIAVLKNYLIKDFLKKFPIQMDEALESDPLLYKSFNDFFTRRLKPNARPIANSRFICPADGFVSQGGHLKINKILQAKGIYYTLENLLGCAQEAKKYHDGDFITIYLSPKDYHRVHMPIHGRLVAQTYIPGNLYSVQPFTAEHIPGLFTKNERLVLHFETDYGPMAMILVGATIVGCIGTSWEGDIKRVKQIENKSFYPPIQIKQGDEVGYFKLGSTVIMLFSEQTHINWKIHLESGNSLKWGQALGS